jgi:hypothetical protein
MGLQPTHRNQNRYVTPAQAGVQTDQELDSRFRGNDHQGSSQPFDRL